MQNEAERLNSVLEDEAPLVARCLSELGRRAAFPKGIPYQSAAAKGAQYNATIGQVTDGAGRPLTVPELADASAAFDSKTCFLYSPQSGHGSLRELWGCRQRDKSVGSKESASLPFVTHGLTQGVSIVAEMFADKDTPILVPAPYWENYNLLFTLRVGADLKPFPLFQNNKFSLDSFSRALRQVRGKKAMLVLNFPHNPTGYTPTEAEGRALVDLIADHPGPLVVLCDDAYAGMVYKEGLLPRSLFWDLLERTDRRRILPIRTDGVTKELLFYSARIGFLTHPFQGAAEAALESKLKCLGRGSVGSPPGPSQAMVMHALRQPNIDTSIRERLDVLHERYQLLRSRLSEIKTDRIVPFPFNSGSFALLGIHPDIPAEGLRQRLLEHSTGVVAVPEVNAVRLAYCSMRTEAIPELVDRIEAVVTAY